jgi:uncharacterized membrane-anchored protein
MRKAIALLAGLVMLAFVDYGIVQRERLLTDGDVVLLQLAPVDPRSLMQGDYMRLDFALAREAWPLGSRAGTADGFLVVALDPRGVASFRRIDDGRPLAADERKLRFRVRGGVPNFATNGYFFEEGTAETYANAGFGEFRVGRDGEMILTGLRDAGLRPLGPTR